ncbi:MAG: AAA family ATPase [Saprospiraceae bacterium]
MKRIMVIGCAGAGKSTFSRALSRLLPALELIHLDQVYWRANWEEPLHADWEKKVQQLVTKETWIMDGNYGRTMDLRIARADTIIFLNYATMTSLYRVCRRTWKYWKTTRPEMTEHCPERFDFNFLQYVALFNRTRRPQLLQKLNNLTTNQQVFILTNDKAVKAFLQQVSKKIINATPS